MGLPLCNKVIDRLTRVDGAGRVTAFRLSDKCAPGSGALLEKAARDLGLTIEDIGPYAMRAMAPKPISSVCAVFAESETMRGEQAQMQPLFAQMRDTTAAKNAASYLDASQALHDILQQHNMKQEQMMCPMLDQTLGAQAAAAIVDGRRAALDARA